MQAQSTALSPPKSVPASELAGGVRLTRQETALLSALQENSGRLLSRQFLLRTVWSYSETAKSRTVDVHIWKLRSKLGPEGKHRIKTAPRVGYYWDPEAAS